MLQNILRSDLPLYAANRLISTSVVPGRLYLIDMPDPFTKIRLIDSLSGRWVVLADERSGSAGNDFYPDEYCLKTMPFGQLRVKSGFNCFSVYEVDLRSLLVAACSLSGHTGVTFHVRANNTLDYELSQVHKIEYDSIQNAVGSGLRK